MANEPLQYGRIYHNYNRGNNGENLFVQQRNYPYFLQLYAKYIQPVAETYAYCLLSNHFHFALRTYTEEEQEAYHRKQIGPISETGSIPKTDPQIGPIQSSNCKNLAERLTTFLSPTLAPSTKQPTALALCLNPHSGAKL